MKALWVIAVCLTLLSLTTAVGADEPKKGDTVTKLLGKWEITKAADESLVGAIVTFEKDGKATIVKKADGQGAKLDGTYKVDKDKLISDIGGNVDTNIIKKLTSDTLEFENIDSKAKTILKKTK
jgi:uncharacterized protein (TIGR03066 family)